MERMINPGCTGHSVKIHRREPLRLPFAYRDDSEDRVLNLEKFGIMCIPVLGRKHLLRKGGVTTPNEHVHEECIEISYCQRGRVAIESMGKTYSFRPGNVFVSRPDEPHRMREFPKGLLMYWMLFRIPKDGFPLLSLPAGEAEWLTESLVGMTQRIFHGGDAVRTAFQRIFDLYDMHKTGAGLKMRMRVAVENLLLSVIDASAAYKKSPVSMGVERLVDEIRRNPENDFRLDDLVDRLALSPSNLTGQFKRLTGLPPKLFRNSCRIEKAKLELSETRRSVAAIAGMLGYPSATYFSKQFKFATGISPLVYRNVKTACMR